MFFTVIQPSGTFWPWLYPLKTVVVGSILLLLVRWFPKLSVKSTWLARTVGIGVFVLWVLPEGAYPLLTAPSPVDPFKSIVVPWVYLWIAFRMIGASVVVPITEELFWRGFLIRWLINEKFQNVATEQWSFWWVGNVIEGLYRDRVKGCDPAYTLTQFPHSSSEPCFSAASLPTHKIVVS